MIVQELDTYNIFIGPVKDAIAATFAERTYSSIIVLVDKNTHLHCYDKISTLLPKHEIIEIEPGEGQKHIGTCEYIWSRMVDLQLDRRALMINLGGGVIGDMGGFCACTYKRGIDFLQIPTTLLSQVDASVGGKLGVDHKGIKNIVGLFQNPIAVIIDPSFLGTLNAAELKSGYAEIVKHGLIADLKLWEDTKNYKPAETNWIDIISRSVAVKKRVVEIDQKEGGLRKILNYGHTIGHAIETYYLDGPKHLLHGEAIAIGMICEAYLAHKIVGLDIEKTNEIKSHLLAIYGHQDIDDLSFDAIIDFMYNDKKNVGGRISFSLVDDLGSCTWDQHGDHQDILESISYYKTI